MHIALVFITKLHKVTYCFMKGGLKLMCMWLHSCMNLERDELSTTYQLGHTSFQLSHWAKQRSGISVHVPFCAHCRGFSGVLQAWI